MKNKFLFTTFVAFLIGIIQSCTPKNIAQTAEVNQIEFDGQVIKVSSTGYGKKGTIAIEEATKNAFEVLLFKGIPNSANANPLVEGSETEAKKTHKKYFETFFSSKQYQTFITYSKVAIGPSHYSKGTKKVTVNIGINIKSLRAELENSGIIRKFGF